MTKDQAGIKQIKSKTSKQTNKSKQSKTKNKQTKNKNKKHKKTRQHKQWNPATSFIGIVLISVNYIEQTKPAEAKTSNEQQQQKQSKTEAVLHGKKCKDMIY